MWDGNDKPRNVEADTVAASQAAARLSAGFMARASVAFHPPAGKKATMIEGLPFWQSTQTDESGRQSPKTAA